MIKGEPFKREQNGFTLFNKTTDWSEKKKKIIVVKKKKRKKKLAAVGFEPTPSK